MAAALFTFHDWQLSRSDTALLRPTAWLNDSCIWAFFSFLQSEARAQNKPVTFLNPWQVQCAREAEDDEELLEIFEEYAGPEGVASNALTFVPINDNRDPSRVQGGSHWSLLVFNRLESERGLPANLVRRINAANPDSNAWALFERAEIDAVRFDELFAAEARALFPSVKAKGKRKGKKNTKRRKRKRRQEEL